MAKSDPQRVVEGLLDDSPPPQSKATLDRMPELVAAILFFLDLKKAGDERAHMTLRWFYTNKLRPKFGGPTYDAARRYIRDTLRRHVTTGEDL